MLTVGSLFAGIGGFDLGFERAGMRTLWQVEQSEFCRRVLERHFPDADRMEDVRRVHSIDLCNGCRECLEPVDLICGGFPCQDLSYAGKGAGLDGERSGLWSEYARIVRELRPRYVVVENVSALLARGLGRVLGDLAEIGYDAEWDCIPASAVGAPHRRDRLWLVAYPARDAEAGAAPPAGSQRERTWTGREPQPVADTAGARRDGRSRRDPEPFGRGERSGWPDADGCRDGDHARSDPDRGRFQVGAELNGEPIEGTADRSSRGRHPDGLRHEMADATCLGRERARAPRNGRAGPSDSGGRERVGDADSPSQDALSTGRRPREATGESGWWTTEPDVGRVAHGVPARVDRLAALGNALVPQIAEWIGRRIIEWEEGELAA